MSRTLEMLAYGMIAAAQIAVAMFLLDHYPPRAAHSRPAAQPVPVRTSLLDPEQAVQPLRSAGPAGIGLYD
jgi:hypothetical protein